MGAGGRVRWGWVDGLGGAGGGLGGAGRWSR